MSEGKDRWPGIYKVQEEMGELGQVLGKICTSPAGHHPDGGRLLQTRAEEELGDVLAALDYFIGANMESLNPVKIEERRMRKLEKFQLWGLSGPGSQGFKEWWQECQRALLLAGVRGARDADWYSFWAEGYTPAEAVLADVQGSTG